MLQLSTFVCFPEERKTKFQLSAIGLSISCVFLWVTLIVYASLPKVRIQFITLYYGFVLLDKCLCLVDESSR